MVVVILVLMCKRNEDAQVTGSGSVTAWIYATDTAIRGGPWAGGGFKRGQREREKKQSQTTSRQDQWLAIVFFPAERERELDVVCWPWSGSRQEVNRALSRAGRQGCQDCGGWGAKVSSLWGILSPLIRSQGPPMAAISFTIGPGSSLFWQGGALCRQHCTNTKLFVQRGKKKKVDPFLLFMYSPRLLVFSLIQTRTIPTVATKTSQLLDLIWSHKLIMTYLDWKQRFFWGKSLVVILNPKTRTEARIEEIKRAIKVVHLSDFRKRLLLCLR